MPVEVVAAMPYSDINTKALEEYRSLVNNHYEEPFDGNFPDYTKYILSAIDNTDEQDTDTTLKMMNVINAYFVEILFNDIHNE